MLLSPWLGLGVAAGAAAGPDTVTVRAVDRAPAAERLADSAAWGKPQIRVQTGQGTASVWLLAAAGSVYLVAALPDTTAYWGDDLVVSIDTEGDRADAPQHDDFQWYLRRMLDSSVVYRGRAGRWEPPQGDPDWRLARGRSGAGWDVAAAERPAGWTAVLRLDRGWLELPGAGTGIALRIYDDAPGGWFAWPLPPPGMHPARGEQQPARWAVVRPSAPAGTFGAAPPGAPGTRP